MVRVVEVTKEQRDAAALRLLRSSKVTLRPTPSQRRAMKAAGLSVTPPIDAVRIQR